MPVVEKLLGVYKLWHEYVRHFPKDSRYTLGGKIDNLFIDTLETITVASFLTPKEKYPYLRRSTVKLDLLKFFLRVAWEIKAFDTKKYTRLSQELDPVGRMLGGWLKQLNKETPAQRRTGE